MQLLSSLRFHLQKVLSTTKARPMIQYMSLRLHPTLLKSIGIKRHLCRIKAGTLPGISLSTLKSGSTIGMKRLKKLLHLITTLWRISISLIRVLWYNAAPLITCLRIESLSEAFGLLCLKL